MKIAIGADHRGFLQKEYIRSIMQPYVWYDVGAYTIERSDYPIFSQKVCEYVLSSRAERGVLLCGTGVGMAIAANRYTKIYAAVAWNIEVAIKSREDDWSNVLVLPSDYITNDQAIAIIDAWLQAKPRTGRYQDRIAMIDALPHK
ncbi:MAG TPA: RpiB/LacA/LacB family sugar-phosphate isomerase [Candidatus Babeliales bacterium]|jgi:ribose 5-phosphate isomerase B|nr:RpiB/LacA/LacB family sugar-phosphate isomerase [Candidatus Babeliales bacterium]